MSQYYGIPDYPMYDVVKLQLENDLRGAQAKLRQAKDDARNSREESWEEGRKTGWNQGWDEAVIQANQEIRKQIADKDAMAAQLNVQHELIAKLAARIEEVEMEKQNMRNQVQKLMPLVDAQSAEKGRLSEENKKLRQAMAVSKSVQEGNLALNTKFVNENRHLQQEVLRLKSKLEALQK